MKNIINMSAKHFSYKAISIIGSILFCLMLAFSTAKAETCTITSMPADNELYGTSQEIGVTMATATTAMREISVVLKWTDKEGKVQTEWLGDGKVATGSLTATATISTMASATISLAKVPDGKYEVFCMKKFDLLPDTVEERPCDQQDMIVMYRGKVLPTRTDGLEVRPCTDTIGVNSTFTKYFGFTGGYPEKRDADGECICAKYNVNEEKQDEKGQTIKGEDGLPIIENKTYKDCSTAYVRFMIKDGAGGEVPDESENPFPNPPIPAFIEDDMQNDVQVINFHVPSSGNCKVFEKSQCPVSSYLTINTFYDEDNSNSPVIFKSKLSPTIDEAYMYKV